MTLRRHGAALLVAAFLVGQLTGLVHQATVKHSRCPEHGELVHGRLVAGQWEAATGAAAEARSVPLSPRDDHDACELEIVGHQRIALPDHPAAVDVSPDPERDALPPALREPGDSLALYLTAPKTSPPA
jgi:hypothetical protein